MAVPASLVAAAGLLGGFGVAELTTRTAGGVVLAGAGAALFVLSRRRAGPGIAGAVTAVYAGGFVLSHLLARATGAWPAVVTVAGVAGVAAHALVDRRRAAALAG